MLVKQNTGKLYQQQKFNLLREETEGFSKLSIALTQLPRSGNDTEISIHVSHIFELVGQFDLDPNRAIDIILDSFELQCWNLTAFLSLLQHFQPSHIAAILGLKFSNEHVLSSSTTESGSTATNVTVAKDVQTSNTKSKDGIKDSISSTTVGLNNNSNITNEPLIQGPPTTTPASLYSLAAILLAHDLVKLDQLLPFLLPIIEDICKDLKKLEQSLRQEIKTYGVVSLTALPPAPSPSVGPTMSTSSNLAVVPSSNQVSSTNISQNTSQNTLQSSGNNGKPPPPLYPKGSTSGIASPPPPPPDKPRPPSGLPSSGTITKVLMKKLFR
jgi:THO complex subunit 2